MQTDLDFEYLYKNRKEAYKELYDLIPKDIDFDENWKIITTSINNLPEVFDIAEKIGVACEPFFTEDIYAPNNKECSVAVVSELKEIVMHQNLIKSFEISEDYIYDISEKLFNSKILTKLYAFKMGKILTDIQDKNIMIFTDGCETGLSTLCTIKSLLNNGVKKIFLFTPIISEDLYQSLDMIVDKIFTSHRLKDFIRISYYFEDFEDVDIEKLRYEVEKRRINING